MATYTPNYNLAKPEMTDPTEDFLTDFGANMDIIDQNLGGGGGSSTLAGLSDVNLTSPVTDDALIYDGAEWVNSPLSAVAFSGNYSDLLNTPTIPTKTSDLNNDSDFVSDSAYVHTDNNFTNADVTKLSGIQAGAEVNVQSDWNEADNTADDYIKNKPTIPTNTSDLNNDSGFLDSSDITVTRVQTTGTKIATIDVDGNSTDLYAPTGGSGGHTIVNESGTALADEPNLQFTDGLKASDDSGNNKTKVGVNTTFTEASTRANINSGDTFSTILGKIKKFFTDLKTVAFSGSYNDLSDKPTIPVGSDYVKKSGDTMTGQLVMRASDDVQMVLNKSHSSTTSQRTALDIGNNIPNGTVGSSYGSIALYGSGSNYTILTADNTTGSRSLYLPDKNGALATTDDVNTKVSKSGDTMTGSLNIQADLAVGHSGHTGEIDLYNTNGNRVSIRPSAFNVIVYLPSTGGTLALTSDIDKVYSTTEKKIGKWIDNRDLYEKTVELTGLTAGGGQSKAHGINNIRQVCHWNAIMIDSTGSENLCNNWLPNAPDWGCFVQGVTPTSVIYYMGGSRLPYISKLIVTVQYTKTS